MHHTCYVCGLTYHHDYGGQAGRPVNAVALTCADCGNEVIRMAADKGLYNLPIPAPTPTYFVTSKWVAVADELKAHRALKAPQMLVCSPPKYNQPPAPPDAEEARLVAILTRPADKAFCMCGRPRKGCEYHDTLSTPAFVSIRDEDFILKVKF